MATNKYLAPSLGALGFAMFAMIISVPFAIQKINEIATAKFPEICKNESKLVVYDKLEYDKLISKIQKSMLIDRELR